MNSSEALILLALLAIAGLLLLTLHKVTALHKASYDLLDNASATRKETESLFAQFQALQALDRLLQLQRPLPPMRGWAGSPDFLLCVAEELQKRRPAVVVECSSGVSTVVAARCLQQLGAGHVWSLEHDAEFAEKTRSLLARHGLSDWATVVHAPLQTTHTTTPWYREEALPTDLAPIEMLIVDGPPTAVGPLARAPALKRLRSRMAPGCLMIIDDAARPDETEMIRRWQAEERGLRVSTLNAEKGLALVALPG